MNFIPTPVAAIPTTPPFYFTWGSYESADWRIPYLSTSMKFEDAAEYLNLAEDIPGMNDIGTNIQELYQRQIDWHKVATGLSPYLRDDSAKFMNALTVVLAPRLGENSKFTAHFGNSDSFAAPALNEGFSVQIPIGPINVGFTGPVTNSDGEFDASSPNVEIGQFVWNPRQVYAVAIDGQHRLAGIKEIMSHGAVDYLRHSRVPVLFILLDPKLGAKSPEPLENTTLKLVRKIFTDLNKHAVKPSRARLILLDDDQPLSLCVKALMDDKISDTLESLKAKYPRVPLSLVDWLTEQAKFERWPFITTVLNMDWLVAEALGIKEVKTMMDFSGLRSQFNALSKSILVDKTNPLKIIHDLETWRLEPYQFSFAVKQEIVDKFRAIYSKPIIDLLAEYSPYKSLIALRLNDDSLTNTWQQWFNLKWRADKLKQTQDLANLQAYEQKLVNHEPRINPEDYKRVLATLEVLKVQNKLAYSVVFQKAYFGAFLKLRDISRVHYEALLASNTAPMDFDFEDIDWDQSEDYEVEETEFSLNNESLTLGATLEDRVSPVLDDLDSNENIEVNVDKQELETTLSTQVLELAAELEHLSDWYVSFMNQVFGNESPLLQPEYQFSNEQGNSQLFWKGSIGNSAGSIDFTKVASDKAAELLEGGALLYSLKSREGRETKYKTFNDIWTDLLSGDDSVPKVVKRLRTNFKALTTANNSIAARILSQLDQDYDYDLAQDQIRWRLMHIWELI